MKIAVFTDTYYPDLNGVTVSVSNYAKELRRQGHRVSIFAPKIRGYKDVEKDVCRLPSVKILSAEPNVRVPIGVSYKGLFNLLRMDFDLVHAHGNGAFSLLGYEVARAEGIPYVLTFHTFHNEYAHYVFNGRVLTPAMIKRILRFIANRCDGVIAPSEKMKKGLAAFGFKKDVMVLPNFVELSQFQVVQKGFLHKKLRLPKDAQIILSVGRIGKEKNFRFLVEMFEYLAAKKTNSHLVFVGQGPEKTILKNLAEKMGLGGRVHFTGRIASEDMPQVYNDADVFVFASTTETQGVCVLEAAAAGLPVVVNDDLAYKNMVVDGRNGYVVPLEKELFAEKVIKLLQDKKLRETFGMQSRKLVEKYFQGSELTEKLVVFYKKMYTKHKFQAKILRRVNRVAARGVRGIRKTRSVIGRVVLSR